MSSMAKKEWLSDRGGGADAGWAFVGLLIGYRMPGEITSGDVVSLYDERKVDYGYAFYSD